MNHDELTQPLGLPPGPASNATSRLSWRGMAAGLACTLGAGAGLIVWINNDGAGGRPRVVVDIERPPKQVAAVPNTDPQPTGTIAEPAATTPGPRASAADVENASGVRVVRQGGGEAPGALIITIPQTPGIGLSPAPDRMLAEKGAHGPLPKIAADGRKAMDVYSRPVATSSKLPADAPRIAIMMGGMGLSQNATRHAMDKLPRAVTLAFAPYGTGLSAQVTTAREKGHEVMLQAPMEPFDLAGDGPGPRMLRTSQSRTEIKDNMHWLMSRFPGYVGVANFLGAKFLADPKAVAPVVEEIGARGLFILDDSSSTQSLIGNIAGATGTPHILADVIIDSERSGAAIEKALLRLETIAREKGIAIGVATGLPETTDRVATFANGLERRGIALIPVSAAAGRLMRPTAKIRVAPGR